MVAKLTGSVQSLRNRLRYIAIPAAVILATGAMLSGGAATASAAPTMPAVQPHFNPSWNGLVYPSSADAVSAIFTVPQLLQCPSSNLPFTGFPLIAEFLGYPEVAQWVGLGGLTDQTGEHPYSPLIQAGIQSECASNGTQTSYVVWQDIPSPESELQQIFNHEHFVYSNPADAGDTIVAAVNYTGGTTFTLSLIDTNPSHGWQWSKTINDSTEHGAPQTAEWIVENPSEQGASPTPLANFGTVHFSLCSVTVPGTSSGQLVTNTEVGKLVAGPPAQTEVGDLSGLATFTIQYLRP